MYLFTCASRILEVKSIFKLYLHLTLGQICQIPSVKVVPLAFHSTAITAHSIIVPLLSCIRLFVTSWTTVCQNPLSFAISWSLLKFISTEPVILSNHPLPPSTPLAFSLSQHQPASFPVSQLFALSGQRIEVSVLASVFPVNIQGDFC